MDFLSVHPRYVTLDFLAKSNESGYLAAMNQLRNHERDWQKIAQRTVLKVNAAWVAQSASTGQMVFGILGFVGVIFWRSFGYEPSFMSLAWATVEGLLLILIATLAISRRHRINRDGALVRLELELGLNSALTTARYGKAAWPCPPSKVKDGLQWQWHRMMIPPVFFIICLLGARLVPLGSAKASTMHTAKPQAWPQMQEWLDKLEQEKVADGESLEARKKKLQALTERPKDEWFSHPSLNASDELREQLKRDIQRLGQQLSDASRSLDALTQYENRLSEAGREQMQKELTEAIKQMHAGAMKPDAELLDQLSRLNPQDLKGLSKEQLKQMQESMKAKAGVCDSIKNGFASNNEDNTLAEDKKTGSQMPTAPNKPSADEEEADRGPGSAPLTLSEETNDFGTEKNEGLTNHDFTKAQPGTLLGMQKDAHEHDQTSTKPQAAGMAKSLGRGGDQVWRDSLSPEEKAVLKQMFR